MVGWCLDDIAQRGAGLTATDYLDSVNIIVPISSQASNRQTVAINAPPPPPSLLHVVEGQQLIVHFRITPG